MDKDKYGEKIVVDAGNLFCPRNLPADDQREGFEEKAKLFINAYRKQGCDALGFGGNDLAALGLDFAKALEKDAGFPFITTNIVDADGKTFFKPGVIVERAGTKYGFLSLACPTTQLPDGLTVRPPVEATKEAAATLTARGAQIIVVLSNLRKQDIETLAKEVDGVDFILGDQHMSMPRFMEAQDTKLVVAAGQKGKYLNLITLNYGDLSKRPFVVRDMGQKFVKELQQLDSRLKRYERLVNSPSKPGTRAANPERYKGIIERQLKERVALVEKIKGLQQVAPDAPYVLFEAAPMNKAQNGDTEVQGWVDAHKKQYPERPPARPKGAAARRVKSPKSVPGATVNIRGASAPATKTSGRPTKAAGTPDKATAPPATGKRQ
jgi:2',3'-cyclic-nucleotide 2'-phosphodiesterase (5'-nucleotidase family)